MSNKMRKHIQKGSALLQSLIAIVVSSSMALVISQMMGENQKEFKRLEARSSINAIHNTILSTMGDQASCSITLRQNDNSIANFNDGDSLTTIKRCNQSIVEDLNADGVEEINCSSSVDLFTVGQNYAKNSIKINSITFKNTAPDGNRLEIEYGIRGTANDSEGKKTRVTGISSITEKVILNVSDNASGYLNCLLDLNSTMNLAIEQSCHGNNAFLDKTGDDWKCYHEVDLPECPAGSAVVAVVGGANHQSPSSYSTWSLGVTSTAPSKKNTGTESAANINSDAITFKCLDVSPVRTDCDDSDATTLDLTIITDKGDDLLTDFYKYECVNVPNCYDETNSTVMYDSSLGFKYLTYNHTDKKFECLEKKCGVGEIALTTEFGEQCISCPAGSVIVKTSTSPGFMCSTARCDDNRVSGTNPSATESAVQQYATGRWNADGTPECRDLVTEDNYCESGGTLNVASDGSIKWDCCPSCNSSFDSERANVCFGQSFTTSNGCTICEGTKDLQTGCPDPTLICPGNDTGTSDCGVSCNPATGTATTCCPSCDSGFDAEKANVCLGQTFIASNGCTQCTGTKPLNSGCDDPANYCTNETLPNSDCNASCGNGTQPVNQGTLSAWSDWSTCDPNTGHTTGSTRTKTCQGATCGGNCGNPTQWQTEDYQDCKIYDVDGDGAQATFLACVNGGGMVRYVNKSTGVSCNNDAQAKSDYLNTANPNCVPLCFFPITNQGTFRNSGSSQAYQGSGCGYNEFQFYPNGDFMPDCPVASGMQWTRLNNFSSALQTNCTCCGSSQGSCNTPSCTSVSSIAGWTWQNRTFNPALFSFAFTIGTDVNRKRSGGSCQNTSTSFFCYPYVFQVGCGR